MRSGANIFEAFSQEATVEGDVIGGPVQYGAGKKGIAAKSVAEGGLWIDGPDILRECSKEATV